MDFRSCYPASGDEEEEGGVNITVSTQKQIVSPKKIHVIMSKDEVDEQHQVKLEVVDTPTFQSSDEEEVDIRELDTKIKIEPMDIGTMSSSVRDSQSKGSLPFKRKRGLTFKHNCPHCPYQQNSSRAYENHLRVHLPGSPAVPCEVCGCHVFPTSLKSHLRYHMKKSWKAGPRIGQSKKCGRKRSQKVPVVTPLPIRIDLTPASQSFIEEDNSEVDDYDAPQPFVIKSEEGFETGVTVMKTQVVSLGRISSSSIFMNGEDDQVESEPESILPHSSRSLEQKSTSHRCPYCPYKSNSRRRLETHFKRHEKSSLRKRKPKKNLTKESESLPNPDYSIHKSEHKGHKTFKCNHCPFKTMNKQDLVKHLTFHDPTSTGIPCGICGVYLRPESMKAHHSVLHASRKRKKVKPKKKKRNPDYTLDKKKLIYNCRQCPFKTIRKRIVLAHAGLHSEGSSAVPCELCKIYVLPEETDLHRETHHSARQPEVGVPNPKNCAHCPHVAQSRQHYQEHLALHSEGSGAISCSDCNVYYRPTGIHKYRHATCWIWKNPIKEPTDENESKDTHQSANPE